MLRRPSKYSHVAEIKSSNDNSRPASAMHVRLLNPGQVKGVTGACIHSTVPYIRDPVPVVILFRALGFVADREILEHIVCDFSDPVLMEMVRPSLEEVRAHRRAHCRAHLHPTTSPARLGMADARRAFSRGAVGRGG